MIHLFTEDILFDTSSLKNTPTWLETIAKTEGFKITCLNYVFCSDEYLLQINKTYLDHDYYTDIITFDNRESDDELESDIFISIERIKENSELHQTTFFDELLRVIVHGLLHLIGYNDQDADQKEQMRNMEDKYLDLYFRVYDIS